MKILAVDTALGACSVAVTDDDRVLAHRCVVMARGHAEALAPMVESAMAEACLPFRALDRLAVTTGPGTFAGQRVGLAFMRGLKLALGRPLTGITTLEAMAAEAGSLSGIGAVAVLHEARRGEVYALFAIEGQVVLPVQVENFETMLTKIAQAAAAAKSKVVALAGTAAEEALAAWIGNGVAARMTAVRQPDALFVARLAHSVVPDDVAPKPLYLRPPDAKLPGGRLPFAVRPALAEESPVLARLQAETMNRPWGDSFVRDLLATGGGRGFLAESGNDPCGFALVRVVADEAELLAIGVSPHERRRGVAAALLNAAVAALTQSGTRSLFLEVDENNLAAIGLYRRAGFRDVGVRKDYYAGEGGGNARVLRLDLPLAPAS
jgi:tRNA threonylcarbamoyladenosine biosynthesis protein TsaB